MRRWRRGREDPPSKGSELDPFLLAMISRLVAARSEGPGRDDDDWVAIEQVVDLTAKMAEAAQTALRAGWDADAERRTLIERRRGPRGIEVRLTDTARDFLGA